MTACGNNSKLLQGKWVGIKYHCADKSFEWDTASRIVHTYDADDRLDIRKLYRLTHTPGAAGLRDNSYCQCEEILNTP